MKILIIEDDLSFRKDLKSKLEKYGDITVCDNFIESVGLINSNNYQIALIDLNLHGDNVGLDLLSQTQKRGLFSIVLSDYDTPDLIKRAYELGCKHYLTKDHFEVVIDSILKEQIERISIETELEQFFRCDFVTQDPLLRSEIRRIKNLCGKNKSVLLLGETGVGKGTIAEIIHKINHGNSNNKEKLIALNATAIPDHLIESEFFGHVKGAFTGANEDRPGKLKLADGGTLFLDEVATMPLPTQKKLLKVLEEKYFFPIGGVNIVRSNFTLVTATCEDIYKKIRDDQFRLDLFHRINGITITIPPLRERKKDIPLLINFFLSKKARKIHLTNAAIQVLTEYHWGGNARELKIFIENLSDGDYRIVDVDDLPAYIKNNRLLPNIQPSTKHPEKLTPEKIEKIDKTEAIEAAEATAATKIMLSDQHFQIIQKHGINHYMEEIEFSAIEKALSACDGVALAAMKMLAMPHSTFYRILKKKQKKLRPHLGTGTPTPT